MKGESKGSCCPPHSWPMLKTEYKGVGETTTVDGTNMYHVGSGQTTLVIVSDIFGAQSGRHHAVADTFAKLGYNVYLPHLLCKPYVGPLDMGPIMEVIKNQNYAKLEGRMDTVIGQLTRKGVGRFHCLAFCWGVWAAFKFASKYNHFVSIAGMHPALGVEQAFGGDELHLARSVNCPAFLYPAGNDPSNIKEKGQFTNILVNRFQSNAGSLTFPDMLHGWTVRGDLNDQKVARDVRLSMQHAHQYYSRFDL